MARRPSTAPMGAQSIPFSTVTNPASTPDLDAIQQAIDDESNVARLLHRLAQDMRENLSEATPLDWHADLDALVSELGRLEQRLGALAESLDVPGGAQIVAPSLHVVDGQGAA